MFHSLHVTLLCAYLPVQVEVMTSSLTTKRKNLGKSPANGSKNAERCIAGSSRKQQLQFKKSKISALIDLECPTFDNHRILLHIMIISYVSDMPECEDFLSVKRGFCSSLPYQNWLISKIGFSSNERENCKILSTTLRTLYDCQGDSKCLQQEHFHQTMLPVPPILHEFSFTVVHELVQT